MDVDDIVAVVEENLEDQKKHKEYKQKHVIKTLLNRRKWLNMNQTFKEELRNKWSSLMHVIGIQCSPGDVEDKKRFMSYEQMLRNALFKGWADNSIQPSILAVFTEINEKY